jgi:hypothetical protein
MQVLRKDIEWFAQDIEVSQGLRIDTTMTYGGDLWARTTKRLDRLKCSALLLRESCDAEELAVLLEEIEVRLLELEQATLHVKPPVRPRYTVHEVQEMEKHLNKQRATDMQAWLVSALQARRVFAVFGFTEQAEATGARLLSDLGDAIQSVAPDSRLR